MLRFPLLRSQEAQEGPRFGLYGHLMGRRALDTCLGSWGFKRGGVVLKFVGVVANLCLQRKLIPLAVFL
jgi:hypothetical protein